MSTAFKSQTLIDATDDVTSADKAFFTSILGEMADGFFKLVADANPFAAFDDSRNGLGFGAGGANALDVYLDREAADVLAVRNAADDGYGIMRASAPVGGNDLVNKTFADANYVNDPATSDLNTGLTFGVIVPWVQLNTAFSDGSVEGRLQWNVEDGTPEIGLPGGQVTLQIGQEFLVRCKNISGVGITNGLAVYVSGASGNRPEVTLADASGSVAAGTPIGIATEDIPHNQLGYVNMGGLVRDVDTDGFAAGSLLYLSDTVPGGYRTTPPAAPNAITTVAFVLKEHATEGILFTEVHAAPNLSDLRDVDHTTPSSDGQFLVWDESGEKRFELEAKYGDLTEDNFQVFASSGDTNPVFATDFANGRIGFGPGGAGALDTFITRVDGDVLTLSDGTNAFEFDFTNGLIKIPTGNNYGIQFGDDAAARTSFFRTASGSDNPTLTLGAGRIFVVSSDVDGPQFNTTTGSKNGLLISMSATGAPVGDYNGLKISQNVLTANETHDAGMIRCLTNLGADPLFEVTQKAAMGLRITTEPGNANTNNVWLYWFNNGGTIELRAKQDDGTVDTIATLS
jgi:hypothetical protein